VPCQCNTQGSLSKLKGTPSQAKINVTSKSPVGDISVVTLIRTDTTLDHSQKAEKVCRSMTNVRSALESKDSLVSCAVDSPSQNSTWHRRFSNDENPTITGSVSDTHNVLTLEVIPYP